MVICTSDWVTADPETTRTTGRRIRAPFWARCSASISPFPTATTLDIEFRRTIRSPAANPALDEIWAFGLRNPWRYNFDERRRAAEPARSSSPTSGRPAWEEIDYEPRGRAGRNYGWRNREGAHDNPNVTPRPPAYLPLTDPIFEYGRTDGRSVTGGFVYRGSRLGAAFRGRYFFGDYVTGRVWSLALTIDGTGEARASDRRDHTTELGGSAVLGNVSSFGVDADGELYIVNYSGSIVRITASSTAACQLRRDSELSV